MRCWQMMTRGVAEMRNLKGEVDVLALADDEQCEKSKKVGADGKK